MSHPQASSLTLRLVEPDGYTVPDGVRTVTPDREADARAELAQLANAHAAEWADFGYHPAGYRILTDPTP
ncbi:hypothetical protein [Streptomyces griseosporeus]